MGVRSSLRGGLVGTACFSYLVGALAAPAALAQTPALTSDIPAKFIVPTAADDYVKRDVMIPMRDGVRLHTVIVIPKGAKGAPIILTRTPYNASKRAERNRSPHMLAMLPEGDEVFVAAGYIRVFQDVRGKYGSEGEYVMTRPLRGPLNASAVDHSTDAYDTIDWLVKNVPESNRKVGMLGSSYEGFTVVMALVNPHPALKVAAPMSPMVDGWMGDDWFHFGAFRQTNYDYFTSQTTARGAGEPVMRDAYDDYEAFRAAGSAGDYGKAAGLDQLPWYRKVVEHPAYDAFWSNQALDKTMAAQPMMKVPTMWIQGLWDQEDMWGAIHCYLAMEPKDTSNTLNFLVMGPWRHSQVNYDGSSLGPLKWAGDTALEFRRDVLKPFFDQYLKDGAPKADTPPVFIYNTGENHWDRLKSWPLACESGCATKSKPLYLTAGFGLSFTAPLAGGATASNGANGGGGNGGNHSGSGNSGSNGGASGGSNGSASGGDNGSASGGGNGSASGGGSGSASGGGSGNANGGGNGGSNGGSGDAKAYDEYMSDPAKPVPYLPRPVRFADGDAWRRWLVTDQRFVDGRPDVLTYVTPPLSEPLRVSGAPVVNLVASTSGTDSDWVVKVIDLYPDEVPSQPEMGGYELNIAMDIFRGRYRESFETPHAIAANVPLPYRFALPMVNHVFEPGHRIMVQVQSTWFPLYDRNPQTFVPNIFFAKPADYVKATQRIYHAAGNASFIDLPVVPMIAAK